MRRMPLTSGVETQLQCGHKVVFLPYPKPADRVWCVRCSDYVYVSFVRGWWARCGTSACSYHTTYNKNGNKTKEQVKRHVEKRGHIVNLYYGTELVEETAPPEGLARPPYIYHGNATLRRRKSA